MVRKSPEDKMREHELGMKWHQDSMKHWRAWGSWFSWGSPVGLGLFFISIGVTFWLILKALSI